jgi:aspartate kinase
MAFIIQKYGGTSLADAASREILAKKVVAARSQGDTVVLVVSAMGRRGDPYATDTLLDMLKEYGGGAGGLTLDLIASCGEIISCCVIASLLNSKGIRALPMSAYSAGIEAGGSFGDATPRRLDPSRILTVLENESIPIVAGFQGIDSQGRIYTFGRGGSDTTAVVLASALGADFVDIYKDVPGVAKADPRVIPDAPFMAFLDYDSMFRLANHGARVLHDKSAILARDSGIKIRVRPTFDDGEGTLIASPGTGYSTPHFIGLATNSMSDGRLKVTAVFARGEGGQEAGRIAQLVQTGKFSAVPVDCGDPDTFAFACNSSDGREFAIALYSILE